MKVVYLAGPFRASTAWGVEQNIRSAEERALRVAEMGASPLCPHTNTRFFDGTLNGEFWLAATLELMRRCDAVLVCPGWQNSAGTRGEIEEAARLGIPVFYAEHVLRDWLKQFRAPASTPRPEQHTRPLTPDIRFTAESKPYGGWD